MIVTPRFVFLHLHKSGGTFVNEALLRHEPGARQFGYHLPRRMVPGPWRHLPVLGLVRSPFTFYLSWYAFQRARERPNALYRAVSDDGAAGFATTIRRLLTLGDDDALLDRVIVALPDRYLTHGLNLPGPALEAIRGSGLGFYSFLYRYPYGHEDNVHIARLERLGAELPAVMARAGVPASAPLAACLHGAEPRNASRHATPRETFDRALAQLVTEREATIIRRFGYAPDRHAPAPRVPALRAAPTSP